MAGSSAGCARPASGPRARSAGREGELALLAEHLESARRGRAGAVVVLGAAGTGKTLLLRDVAAAAGDFQVVSLRAAQHESQVRYAALESLVRALPPAVGTLPAPQRHALAVVTGREAGEVPDPLLVGLATEALLTGAGRLLCLVDDAHRMDAASLRALSTAAHRMRHGHGLLVLAGRPGVLEEWLEGSTHVRLPPLDHAQMHRVLDVLLETPIEPRVREQLVAESRGNPGAVREFLDLVEPAALAGGLGVPSAARVLDPPAAVDGLLGQVDALPQHVRTLLVLAAAEPTGDREVLHRAAQHLGLRLQDLAAAADRGLVDVGTRVLFGDPRLRAHVYRSAGPSLRRRVHAALAEALQDGSDPDLRAWCSALAATGPDDDLARDLVERAGAARSRGAVAAAALLLERAAALTTSPAGRADLQWRAGRAWQESGDLARARSSIATVAAHTRDPRRRAQAELLMARMAYDQRHGQHEVEQLIDVVAALPPGTGAEARLRALVGTMISGPPSARERLARPGAGAPVRPDAPPSFVEEALEALTAASEDRPASAIARSQRAVAALDRVPDVSADIDFMWIYLVCAVAWDETTLLRTARRYVDDVRRCGRLSQAGLAYNYAAVLEMHAGHLDRAEELSRRARRVRELTGARENHRVDLLLAAWRGQGARVGELARACRELAAQNGETRVLATVACANALLHNGAGRYTAALRALEPARTDVGFAPFLLPEEVEAAVRTGEAERARRAHRLLQRWSAGAGTPWARGLDLRCRALLLGPAEEADALHRESVAVLGTGESTSQVARARLLHGEWLRRARRHREAREQLGLAHEVFAAVGANGFASRAARELTAAGGAPRAADGVELTAQQRAVARLAAGGATSKEIAAALVVSPRTVHAHLRTVFAKLGVESRRSLRDALVEHGLEAGEDRAVPGGHRGGRRGSVPDRPAGRVP
ncbi:AAA family ATPase [Kineococcus gypseus]|uniref:AAA family ATPase n=1 Tax=Kineococcus gypseus TaxID=1637102 RepID=UPI003D7CB7F2